MPQRITKDGLVVLLNAFATHCQNKRWAEAKKIQDYLWELLETT